MVMDPVYTCPFRSLQQPVGNVRLAAVAVSLYRMVATSNGFCGVTVTRRTSTLSR